MIEPPHAPPGQPRRRRRGSSRHAGAGRADGGGQDQRRQAAGGAARRARSSIPTPRSPRRPACRSRRSSRALGEPAFRDGERRVIARLLAERPGVLATGGGAFIEPRTRAEIKARATSVWLRADLDLLWDRVRDRPGRPLLQAADPRGVLADLERRRSPIYAEADVIVDSRRGASHEAMARAILAAVAGARPRLPGRPPGARWRSRHDRGDRHGAARRARLRHPHRPRAPRRGPAPRSRRCSAGRASRS